MTNEDLSGRLKAFALIFKFGHDLFGAKNFSDAAARAVSDSRVLLNFRTAALFEYVDGRASLAAQFGQVGPNPHSRLAVVQKAFAESLNLNKEPQTVSRENGLPEELAQNDGIYICLKLAPPAHVENPGVEFLWLLEYAKEIPDYVPNTMKLMAASISEALYFRKLCRSGQWNVRRHVKKRWIWAVTLLILTAAMFCRVPENATAEFTLKAPEITTAYAWFDGPVAKCFKQDGVTVKKGDVVAEYDAAQLQYRLGIAKASLRETEAELSLEQRNAFTDQEKLGKVKLLEARRDIMRVSVKEAEWYLAHSKLAAPADGILSLADGRAEQLSGKAVRTGDKLFEVFGGSGMIAEIPVNERDASILRNELSATLFLHTAPETAIPARILEVSHYPELTEQRTYCYKVRAKLPDETSGLRYGMRGVAKLSGDKVSLGYSLFKSVVLYFRGL